jgi:putative acetyltransferase
MIKLLRCNSDNKNFHDLVSLLNDDLNSRYGFLQAQYEKFNKIEAIETVVVAYQDTIPVGCGCFKKFDTDSVEIKRMFVKEENRGQGIAKLILTELEKWGVENGYRNSILETSIKQLEAIRFYTNFGYKKIENFGQYIGNANSICMRKIIAL